MKQRFLAVLLMAVGLIAAPRAWADAVYMGSADAVLTVDSITGGNATSLFAIPSLLKSDSHTATGSGSSLSSSTALTTITPPTLTQGGTMTLAGMISGTVPSNTNGSATSLATNSGTLSLVNAGSDTLTLSFTLDYRYFEQASTSANGESANLSGSVGLSTTLAGTDSTLLALTPSATAQNGMVTVNQSTGYPNFTSYQFSLTLGAGQTASITFGTALSGSANVVPEPSSLALVGIAVAAALPLSVRRKRRAAV